MTSPCNCYYGEDCTKTTVCANESIVQDLHSRIAELDAKIAHQLSWKIVLEDQMDFAGKRIAELEAALYPIGKLGYDQTPRQLGMSVKALGRIRVLIANSEVET